jgi:hypothetical protein
MIRRIVRHHPIFTWSVASVIVMQAGFVMHLFKDFKTVDTHPLEAVGRSSSFLKAPPRKTVAPYFFTISAVVIACFSFSMAHGPAMITGLLPSPILIPSIVITGIHADASHD